MIARESAMIGRDLRRFVREFATLPRNLAILARPSAMIGDDVHDHRARPSDISA
jgi:hypothetical protein